jgi:hypothetical protein
MTTIRIDGYGPLNDEARAKAELLARVDAEAQANWHNPEWRREMAAAMFTTIYRGFDHENLLDFMIQVERVGRGDQVYVKEVRGLRAFWIARGGQIDASQLRENVVPVPRDILGFHVFELDDRLEDNFSATQEDVVNLAIKEMDSQINLWLLRLFQTAIPDASSPYYSEGPGLALDDLKAMIRAVQDESESGEVTVFGRSTMIGQVYDAIEDSGLFVPEANQMLLERGMIGRYHNARLYQLRNYRNDLEQSIFPANELFVMARDAGKFAFYGGMKGQEWSEQGGKYWHSMAEREVGALVYRAERARRFVDTDQPA